MSAKKTKQSLFAFESENARHKLSKTASQGKYIFYLLRRIFGRKI